MNTHFSIGEVAKMHNISIQTLRHYDKIGLLKPAYINEKSKYRYYSVKHFVVIDFIKQCKAMGLSLDEIKVLVDNYTSIDSILSTITKQKDMIEEKIKELNTIKNNIETLEHKIQAFLEEGIDKVFIKYFEEKHFVKYHSTKRYTEEFEIQLTQALGAIEKKYGSTHKELAFAISYDHFKNRGELMYDHILIDSNNALELSESKMITLKAGYYITINFDDDYRDTSKYYQKLVDYIRQNELKVSDTFFERYIITRVGNNNEERALGQIQILLRD